MFKQIEIKIMSCLPQFRKRQARFLRKYAKSNNARSLPHQALCHHIWLVAKSRHSLVNTLPHLRADTRRAIEHTRDSSTRDPSYASYLFTCHHIQIPLVVYTCSLSTINYSIEIRHCQGNQRKYYCNSALTNKVKSLKSEHVYTMSRRKLFAENYEPSRILLQKDKSCFTRFE